MSQELETNESVIFVSQHKHLMIENDAVHRYISEVHYSNYNSSLVERYAIESGYRMDWGVSFRFPVVEDTVYLKLYEVPNNNLLFTGSLRTETAQDFISAMIPGRVIMYELCDYEKTHIVLVKDTIAIDGKCRMVKANKAKNIRDIGGLETINGAKVKYGKIYRGGAISAKDLTDSLLFRDILNVGVEIDIRSIQELSLDDSDPTNDRNYSLLGNNVEYYHCPLPLDGFLHAHSTYADIFRTIVNALKNNKSVYIHCAGGADRTGALFMLLESVLGVSKSDIAKDFELTSFAPAYYDSNNYRYCTRCKTVLNYFSNLGSGYKTLQENIKDFFKNEGIMDWEIEEFQSLMLD